MKHLITLSVAAATAFTVHAQDLKFGKFTNEEISKSASTITPSASAEVLYSNASYTIDFDKATGELLKNVKIHYRIKVFNKDKAPDNILSVEIPIRKGNSKTDTEKIFSFKGSTFIPENGGMKEMKIDKKDIFTKNIHNYLDIQTATFPNVKDGSILEYTYEVSSPFYSTTDTWYFQENIPVVKSDLSIATHEYLKYQDDFRGEYSLTPKISIRKEKGVYTTGGIHSGERGPGYIPSKLSYNNYEYTLNVKSYSAENLVGYENEAYVLNPRNILSSVRFELAAYVPRNGISKYFATTWEEIGKDLMYNESFGRQLSGNVFLDDKVKELINGKNSNEEKLFSIFNFVKSNYTWDGYNSIYTDKGIKKTFNEKNGNVAEINLMLVSMLEKAGFNANPVVLSTVQNGLLNYIFPSKTKLNYVIASVIMDGNEVLLDATDVHSQPNLLPMRALNQRGIMIGKNNVKEINLVNTVLSTNREQIVATLTANGKINGTFSNYHDNYFYMNDKRSLAADPKGFEKEFIEDYAFEIDGFKSHDNGEGLIRHSFKFENLQVDVAGNKIIFNPLLFTANLHHDLHYDTRTYNIEFGTPMNINKSVKIKIPDGYQIENLPHNSQEKIINDAAGYAYKIEEKDGFILVSSARVFPYSVLPSDYYKPFKEFMNKVVQAETQQIILIKK